MCNRKKTHCPLCHLRFCVYNWPPFNVQRCKLKSFLGPLAQELEMDLPTLRDRIQSQYKDHGMFWDNYISQWYIDKNTTCVEKWMSQPQNSKVVGMSNTLSDVYKAVGYSRRAGVQAIQRLVPDKYKMRLRDVKIDLQGVLKPSRQSFAERSRRLLLQVLK